MTTWLSVVSVLQEVYPLKKVIMLSPSEELEDGHINVVCRVRPSNPRELRSSTSSSSSFSEKESPLNCLRVADDEMTISLYSKGDAKNFTYDYSANENVYQETIFEQVGLPITKRCLQGYNGTILCYGQTGSKRETRN
jgi:hypothetical protein